MSPGLSNSNKLSNEDSSINSFTIDNNMNLNRFTGTDKLDNSKRINFGFNLNNDHLDATFLQTYEFTNNSNFHYSQGNENKLSDFLGQIIYDSNNYKLGYNFRYDTDNEFAKSQNLNFNYIGKIVDAKINYLDQKSKTDETIVTDNETINYQFDSKKIYKYSKISYFGLYDANNQTNK